MRFPAHRRWLGLAIAALMVVAFGLVQTPSRALAWPTPAITDAQAALHEQTTRLVLGLTHPVPFQIHTLANPPRVIIDLMSVEWQPSPTALPTRVGVLNNLRRESSKPGMFRMVLNCNAPTQVTSAFLMQPPGHQNYQLVVDLVANRPPVVPRALVANASVLAARPSSVGKPLDPVKPAVAPVIPGETVLAPPLRKPRAELSPNVVVLDPGHGGEDPGAISVSGLREKDITLATARAVRDQLQRLGNYKIVLTRDRDVFVRLRDRVAMARAAGGDLFVSIHADATGNHATRGLSVYTLSEQASDTEAAALADRENKADVISGVDFSNKTPEVANILIDLSQRESMNRSARLASLLVNRLQDQTQLLPNTHRFAGFAVLKAPDVPSVLIELGYLSNAKEEQMLQNKSYQNKLARAVSEAIRNYFGRIEEASAP